jgi:hypothetical protein
MSEEQEILQQLEQLETQFHQLSPDQQQLCLQQFQTVIKQVYPINDTKCMHLWYYSQMCVCGCKGLFVCKSNNPTNICHEFTQTQHS